ncbi:MAG: putative major pilin subunit [Phycisphaerales bacterium]|nr:putative major pilin subunit [Phycisphaerales bacterium]
MLPIRRPASARRGVSLTDLCIVLVVLVLLFGAMVPALLSTAGEMSNRVKCAGNLRQIGLVMIMYANAERNGGFPRTYFDRDSSSLLSDTTGYNVKDSFSKGEGPSPVGNNNVTASFFLALKTMDITPDVFICPSTPGQPGFTPGQPGTGNNAVQNASNWATIPLNMTYSVNVMFPSQAAVQTGWKWNNTLNYEFAIAADINSGAQGLATISPGATREQFRAVNSPNHNGDGENVLFGDGHVEFTSTPFCGMTRPGTTFKDNVYTSGSSVQTIGQMPVDLYDSVMLPVTDPKFQPLSSGLASFDVGSIPLLGIVGAVAGAVILGGVVLAIVMTAKRRAARSDNSPQP